VLRTHLGDYYSDQLAARLTPLDPDRAFGLLARSIHDDRLEERWNPLSSGPALKFWDKLSQVDRRAALSTVLDATGDGGAARWTVLWHLPNLVNLQTDGPFLLEYAARGEREALSVCAAITGGREGFWNLAFGLIDRYPNGGSIRAELEQRIQRMGQVVRGPWSDHHRQCLADIEQARALPGVSARAIAWLDDYARRMQQGLEEQLRREADERVNRG
jgi:hypothetical protein